MTFTNEYIQAIHLGQTTAWEIYVLPGMALGGMLYPSVPMLVILTLILTKVVSVRFHYNFKSFIYCDFV